MLEAEDKFGSSIGVFIKEDEVVNIISLILLVSLTLSIKQLKIKEVKNIN